MRSALGVAVLALILAPTAAAAAPFERGMLLVSGDPKNPYRALIDATERDVRLTTVGGDPLAGDVAVMTSLKGRDFETVKSTCGAFAKGIDVTKAGVPSGTQTLAGVRAKLA